MAVQISPAVEATYDLRHQPKNHLLIRSARLRGLTRAVSRRFSRVPEPASASFEVGSGLEQSADVFRDRGWAYIEDFFTSETHEAILSGWPPRAFFEPMTNIYKSYDFGFRWECKSPLPAEFARFPAVKQAFDLLSSDETARRVTELCGDGVERVCHATLLSWATTGSSLIPHLDSVADDPDGDDFVNLIMFVDGSGGPQAGGTCIIGDNEYRDVIFEPTNLRNSALIYKSADSSFFHGFKPMRPGTFRWAMNAEYAPASYPA